MGACRLVNDFVANILDHINAIFPFARIVLLPHAYLSIPSGNTASACCTECTMY